MSKQVFSSIGKLGSGSYDEIEVNGVMEIMGDITFSSMEIDGVCKGKGALNGKELRIDGVVKTKGDIKVEYLEVDGVLKSNQKIYASEIEVDGVISNSDEVNGDDVMIDGVCDLNEVVGDRICIDGIRNRTNFKIGSKEFHLDFGKKKESCQVKVVECTCFRGRGVTCERISANEIVLHDGCIVDVIECDGTLKYDESCRVGSINGDCMVVKED